MQVIGWSFICVTNNICHFCRLHRIFTAYSVAVLEWMCNQNQRFSKDFLFSTSRFNFRAYSTCMKWSSSHLRCERKQWTIHSNIILCRDFLFITWTFFMHESHQQCFQLYFVSWVCVTGLTFLISKEKSKQSAVHITIRHVSRRRLEKQWNSFFLTVTKPTYFNFSCNIMHK